MDFPRLWTLSASPALARSCGSWLLRKSRLTFTNHSLALSNKSQKQAQIIYEAWLSFCTSHNDTIFFWEDPGLFWKISNVATFFLNYWNYHSSLSYSWSNFPRHRRGCTLLSVPEEMLSFFFCVIYITYLYILYVVFFLLGKGLYIYHELWTELAENDWSYTLKMET